MNLNGTKSIIIWIHRLKLISIQISIMIDIHYYYHATQIKMISTIRNHHY